jgi:hypothetical protein
MSFEYLLSYGRLGDFGRFRSATPLICQRGDRAVVRSHRGLEIAEVLGEARPGHAHFLPNTSVGQLLRLVGPEDERTDARMRQRGQQLFERGRALAVEIGLPLELIDVEVLLDSQHAALHLLRWQDCDVRPFVSTLSREFEVHILLTDLAQPRAGLPEEEETHGCSRADCGSGGGGCGSCSSCHSGHDSVRTHFAGLREQMERRRTALL